MVERVCGTGDWNGPKPGDPDSTNLILTATPAFGGIDINWTFPLVNPYAVSYTILYRSLLPDPNTKQLLANVAGNFFYDKTTISVNTLYYYWIQVVSINGTVGELIGPAWARARPLIADLIEQLTGQIDAGVLAQSLKEPIDQITLNKLAITQEMLDRDAADDTYGVMLNEIRGDLNNNTSLLQQEVLARVTADEAFVSTVNTLYSDFAGNIAAVQTEQRALSTKLEATAASITTVQSKLEENLASVQVNLSTTIKRVGDTVTEIGALYTAKVDVNGLIGGFGIYNDGTIVDAGFDVDRFWIGRTGANKRKPFIVQGGEVFIDQAVIYQLTFSKLRDEAGAFVVQNGKVQAKYIDAENLVVKSAAEFTGTIGTNQIPGLGALATLNAYSYAALTGTKPPTNADNTGSNTSANTNAVAGTAAATVRDNAANGANAAARVNDWTRPGTTLIYGNKIWTGDAYVDTLQIKGNAVTVPSVTSASWPASSTSWIDTLVLQITMDEPGYLFAMSSGTIAYGSGFGDTSTRILIDGQDVSSGGGSESWVNASHSGALYVGAGSHSISLQIQSPSGKGRLLGRTLFGMAVQR